MEIKNKKTWTLKDRDWMTNFNQQMIKDMKKYIEQFDTDPKKDMRLERQLCKTCVYQDKRMVLNAFTYVNCSKCNCDMTFPNSSIDKLCERCAKMLEACKHCGAHMD